MVKMIEFPVIDLEATGRNIRELRLECGLTVREVQGFFGFQEPRAIYQWQKGRALPTVENLIALSKLFGVQMEDILVLRGPNDVDGKRRMTTEIKKNRQINKILFFCAA